MTNTVRACHGFTLVELIVAIAVAAILLTTAVPAFQDTIKNNRMAANVNEFIAALNLARSEAIKRGVPVTACKDGGSGNACNNAAQWAQGWIVFSDVNDNNVVNPGTGACLPTEDCVLRVYPALNPTYTFRGNNNVANRVTYNAKGFSAAGTLFMCDDRGESAGRKIVIARTGRAQAEHTSASDQCV
jgi:type IV fimbrial biogenesis protein FimT